MTIKDFKNYTVLPSSAGKVPAPTSSPQPEQSTSLGQGILNAGTAVTNFLGGKGVADTFGATIAKIGKTPQEKEIISQDQPTVKQTIGSGLQLGANFIPGAGELEGAGALAKVGAKVGAGLGTGYAMDVGSKLQNNQEQPFSPGVGTAVGGALPVVGAAGGAASRIVGRLLKGLGSGISGVSSKTLDSILNNPEVAQMASDKLAKSGNYKVLEDNAKTLINGVGKIQNEASSAYRTGLDKLSNIDIKPDKLKKGIEGALQKHNIGIGADGIVDFSKAEFLDPKIQQRAESVISKVSQQEDISGAGIRKLMDVVDNSKFKSTGADGDRQAFNAFVGDLKKGLEDGVNASTDKLGEINKKYSADKQLSEAAQHIFGNVDFKNVSEVASAAKKLEGLFSAKGLDPQTIDNYLTRIGISPKDFRTSEAVRQITNKEPSPQNTPGFNIGEITRTATGSVMTPEMVKNITIKTGLAKEKLTPLLNGLKTLSPALQKTLIQALLQIQ